MTQTSIRRTITIIAIFLFSMGSIAQTSDIRVVKETVVAKPYKILTSGKQITVKSTKEIKSVMVWTASGHRVVEQKEINSTSYSFSININERFFFVMIQYEGMKPFTEKVGL